MEENDTKRESGPVPNSSLTGERRANTPDDTDGENDGTEQPGERLYSVREMAEMLGYQYERVRTYTRQPAISQRLGGRPVTGVKGPRYPAQAIQDLQELMQAADQGLISPGHAVAWLNLSKTEQILPERPGVPEAVSGHDRALAVSDGQQRLVRAISEALTQQAQATDRLAQEQRRTNELLERQITLLEAQAQARELPAPLADPAPPTPAPAPEPVPRGFLARLLGR